MKTNLKNRPKVTTERNPFEFERWFLAFEKELREKALDIDKPSNDYGEVCKQNREYRRLLKEILGEG